MNDKYNLISIIVPVYNSEKYLEKCINSIINQTYKNLEIILVNDGSTDDSLSLCEKYAEKDTRIKVFSKNNGGLSSARNYGISKSNGAYIGFVDSDDYIELDMYESMMRCMLENSADIVVQPFIFHLSRNDKPQVIDTYNLISLDGKQAIVEMLRGKIFAGQVCNKLFKRPLLNECTFREDILLYEDMVSMWDVIIKCEKLVWQDKHSYHYIMHWDSLMHSEYSTKKITGRTAAQILLEKARNELEDAIVCAEAFLIRVNWDLCKRAWRTKSLDIKIKKKEFSELKKTLKQVSKESIKCLSKKDRTIILVCGYNVIFLRIYLAIKKYYKMIMVAKREKRR